ncbi:MAG: hypothetical protein DRI79_01290 [Chloroflexi bacterium]|nr:MAG: hypothetical protein DRI79_01290 [Chloroflexota bacterium]
MRFKSLAFLFVLALVTFSTAGLPIAGAQAPPSPGVDLIILLDQSGSMSGSAGYRATDPTERRVQTAQYLIDYMAFDGNSVHPERTNRVVVVGFGSPGKTHILVPLTSLEDADIISDAKNAIVAENLGNTSFISALELVRQVFPAATDAELESDTRQRLIVLITDGGPYDARAERVENPYTYADYFEELTDYCDAELSLFTLYIIGIDDANRYWPQVKSRWEDVAGPGHAVRVSSVEEMNREIVRLVCPFLNPDKPADYCQVSVLGYHFIQPYARSVSFSFFKYNPEARITLRRPDATLVNVDCYDKRKWDADVINVTCTETPEGNTRDEMYEISNPDPGCWQSAREGTGQVDVFVQPIFNQLWIKNPSGPHPENLPMRFELGLLDSNGKPIDELPGYPIVMKGHLTMPDGSHQRIDFQQTGIGEYISVIPVLPLIPGPYTLRVQVSTVLTPTPELRRCLTFTQDSLVLPLFESNFQIPVYAPQVEILAPGQPYLRYGPVTELVLGFVDPDGNPIGVPEDTPWSVDLSAQTPSGEIAELPSPQWDSGNYRVDEPFFLGETGPYSLTVALRDDADAELFEYQTVFETTENVYVYSPGPNYPALAPLRMVELELRDSNDEPVEVDPNYPLDIVVRLIRPDGSVEEAALSPAQQPGRYFSTVNWVLEDPSPHSLEIIGYTNLRAGEPVQAAFVAHREINVSPNLPYFFVLSPDEEEPEPTYPLHYWYLPPLLPFARQPMPVRVELRHGNQPARAEEFFITPPDQLFTLEIEGPDGQAWHVNLQDVSGKGQVFGADVPDLVEPGQYTATVRLDGAIRGGVPTEGAWPPRTVVFQRNDPLLYPILWWFGIAVVALSIAYPIGRTILNWRLPAVKGKLIAEVIGGRVIDDDLLSRTKRRHWMVLKGKQIGASLQLRRIKVRRVAKKGRRGDQLIEGVEIWAYNLKGKEVAHGTMYAKRGQNILIVKGQRTNEDERYQFRYEI